jgi:hypothetical protein
MRLRGTIVLLGLGLVGVDLAACSSNNAKPPGGDTPDDCTIAPVLDVFANRCATSGACHVSGGQYPDFTPSGLAGWKGKTSKAMPAEPLVVAGNPDASWVYRKVAGTHGSSGALMPLGAAMPIAEADVIRDWIADGAATQCKGEELPTTPVRVDPNNLDQTELFSCKDPTAPKSSVARIRRIDQVEWTHGIGAPNAATFTNLTAYLNPFSSRSAGAYSTYSADNTVDSATLDLYFLNLPEAGVSWDNQYATMRSHAVINDQSLKCFFNDAVPTSECIDNFVTKLLQVGVLSRTPTPEEIARLEDYTVAALAREPGGGQTGAARSATIREISAAAWMTAGALFRSEIGAPVAGDAAGRRRLTNEELALAIGSVLSTHRPGSLIWAGFQYLPPAPDDADLDRGWLQQIRAAADNGTIQDLAVMRSLIATYASNIDLERRDILFDKFNDTRDVPARGEYVLAPRIIGFFREWLDYQGALSSFKDTPGGTSKYKTTTSLYDRTTGGFTNLQTRYYMHETTLVEQLDDTIARTVIESAASGNDVFAALFTSLQWRLPSDHVNLNSQTCLQDSDCTMDPNYKSCNPVFKVCGDSVSGSTSHHARVYNVEGVPDTQAGRWVTMNAAERSGVLTHPAWLAAHGANFEDDASLVHRGKWIREKLFCQTVPGLENVMVQAKLGAHGPSARERVDEATTTGANAQTCQGCHSLMNPLGYAFEIYDHAGFLRETDHGHPPDGTTTITNAPDPELNRSFQNAVEFSQAIADSPHAKRCFVRQAFRYFTGRDETLKDACTLTAMESALDKGSFVDMLTVLVESDTFQYRTIEGGTP